MPFVPTFLPALDAIRGIGGALGLRATTCSIVRRTYAGTRRASSTGYTDGGDGPGNTPLPLVTASGAPYKIRHVSQREIASSGGRLEQGDVIIGPITNAYAATSSTPAGGFTEAQLAPPGSEGIEIIYRLALTAGATSGIAGDFYLVEIRRDHAMHMHLVVRRLTTTPGF